MPAFGVQHRSGDKAISHQETDGIGNILRLAYATHWQAGSHGIERCRLGVTGNVLPDWRVDPTW